MSYARLGETSSQAPAPAPIDPNSGPLVLLGLSLVGATAVYNFDKGRKRQATTQLIGLSAALFTILFGVVPASVLFPPPK